MAKHARPLQHDTQPAIEEAQRRASHSETRLRGPAETDEPRRDEDFERRDTDPSPPPHTPILLAHWLQLDTAANVRTLLIENKVDLLADGELARHVRCFVSDVRDVSDVLFEMHCDLREWMDHPVIPPHAWFGYIEQVYAWLTGALDQVDETLEIFGDDPESVAWSMRSLVEFSSLYVRGLLEPGSAAALELHRQAGDLRTCELLSALHERILWLGFTIKSFDSRRARGAC
jgi:hypothetical protein